MEDLDPHCPDYPSVGPLTITPADLLVPYLTQLPAHLSSCYSILPQPPGLNPPPSSPLALGPRSGSLLSLQTELLLDLVAEAQSRRLEEQRAAFHTPKVPPSLAPTPPRLLEDKEQLYSTILSHQVRHTPPHMRPRRQDPGLLTEP